MIVGANRRVCEVAGIFCRSGPTQSGYKTAAPGGPAGSSLMTFAAVVEVVGLASNVESNYVFNRDAGGSPGWGISIAQTTGIAAFYAGNSTPATVAITTPALPTKQIVILIARYNGVPNPGNIQGSYNGVTVGPTSLGTGFSAAAVATMIGTRTTAVTHNCDYVRVYECVHLDAYDVVATYNTSYGTGFAGLYAKWAEDLQGGRYLSPPHASGLWTANDHYWSARDVVQGSGTKTTWTDRGPNAVAMTKAGVPQSCSMTPRFL